MLVYNHFRLIFHIALITMSIRSFLITLVVLAALCRLVAEQYGYDEYGGGHGRGGGYEVGYGGRYSPGYSGQYGDRYGRGYRG